MIVLKDRASRTLRDQLIGGGDVADRLYQRDMVLTQGPRTTAGQRRELLASSATGAALNRLAGILTSQYEVVYSRPSRLIPPEESQCGCGGTI